MVIRVLTFDATLLGAGMVWNGTLSLEVHEVGRTCIYKLLKGRVLTRVAVCHVAAPNIGHCYSPTLRRKMVLFLRPIEKKTSRTKATVQKFPA